MLKRFVFLFCDGPGCGEAFETDTQDGNEARYLANHRAGWGHTFPEPGRATGRRADFCRRCVEDLAAATEKHRAEVLARATEKRQARRKRPA